jgi:hypothetical protein
MDDHTKRDARKFRDNLRNQAIALIDLERGLPELLNECNRQWVLKKSVNRNVLLAAIIAAIEFSSHLS